MHKTESQTELEYKIGSKLMVTFIILYSKLTKGNYICRHTRDCGNARKHIFLLLPLLKWTTRHTHIHAHMHTRALK